MIARSSSGIPLFLLLAILLNLLVAPRLAAAPFENALVNSNGRLPRQEVIAQPGDADGVSGAKGRLVQEIDDDEECNYDEPFRRSIDLNGEAILIKIRYVGFLSIHLFVIKGSNSAGN
jgi:hypothetical protein